MAWDTAANIINDAAVEVGLTPLGAGQDPWASQDPNYVQMAYLLKSSGRELGRKREWTHLRRSYSFTTVAGQSQYPYPTDFRNMIDQTQWNRTNRLPLGIMGAQEWTYLKSRLTGVVFTVIFRQMNNTINIYPDVGTPAGYNIAFDYMSSAWVRSTTAANPVPAFVAGTTYTAGDSVRAAATGGDYWTCSTTATPTLAGDDPALLTTGAQVDGDKVTTTASTTMVWVYHVAPNTDAPSTGTDVIHFDPYLMSRMLKLAFLRNKGFDTQAAQQDFEVALAGVAGDDSTSPVLNFNKRSTIPEPLLGGGNFPITGFGS